MTKIQVRSGFSAFIISVAVVMMSTVGAGAQAPVPQTGQQDCWDSSGNPISCTGTGQDGEHQAGVPFPTPRFTALGDGTVVDYLTGLAWLQDAGCFAGQTWENALAEIAALNSGSRACAGYVAGTYGDWHLPNVHEFASLWDYGEWGPSLTDGHPFVNGPAGDYWSSTTSFKFTNRAWTGDAGTGQVYDEDKDKTLVKSVWAVRGPVIGAPAPVAKTGQQDCWNAAGGSMNCAGTGQDGEFQAGVAWPSPRLSDLGNGTVLDNLTGLIWLKDAECFGWQQWVPALSEIASLNAGTRTCVDYAPGTFSDWRLANVRELLSLWDYGRDDPALPESHPFVNVPTPGVSYWTSSTVDGSRGDAWKAKTYTGSTFTDPKSTHWRVWAVRGGPVNAIFGDGFESGTTSAWSNTVP